MQNKTKIYLILGGIITIIILIAVIYIYLTAGIEGLWVTFLVTIVVFAFLIWIITESRRPRREPTLEELEERKAYVQRRGQLLAEEDERRRVEWERQQRKRRRDAEEDLLGIKWFRKYFR